MKITALLLLAATHAACAGIEMPGPPFWSCRSLRHDTNTAEHIHLDGLTFVQNAFGATNSGFGEQTIHVHRGAPGSFRTTFRHTLGDPGDPTHGWTHGAPWCYEGWWWDVTSPGSRLPIRVADFDAEVDWTIATEASGSWNAHLQLYTTRTENPRPGWDDVSCDIFICIDRHDWNPEEWGEQPVGEFEIGGARWIAYRNPDKHNMCSFYLKEPTRNLRGLRLQPLFAWMQQHGWVDPQHHVVCLGAAFEMRAGDLELASLEFRHQIHPVTRTTSSGR